MSASFTPGPWVAGRNVIAGQRSIYCDRINPSIGNVWIYTDAEDECDANANLIAAAPDLYAALEAALLEMPATCSAFQDAQAALAKAEAQS